MLNLSVIILTFNEELHIRRCLDNVNKFASNVYVIDCYSSDRTVAISKEMGAVVIQHEWPGNQASQFNWALKNIDIRTDWILRLDADEYLLPELIDELKEKLPLLDANTTGIVFNRRHIFMNKWMKRGIYPVKLMRAFRKGKAICEQRLMDEHIQLLEGTSIEFVHDFCDHNLNDLSWFCTKHINYAVREAAELLDIEYDFSGHADSDTDKNLSRQAQIKRQKKHKYARQPLFWRSFMYFCYRYFFKGAFLDGKVGFIWTFIQGWWYRSLVDAKVYEIKETCGNDKEKIRQHLKEHYKITI